MVPQPRGGSFSPTPSAHSLQTGTSHSPHPAHTQTSLLSAAASPSINSPTGSNSITNIVVAQVYFLLGSLQDDKDRSKWESHVDQLRKLVDDSGMEVFSKYFARLVAANASHIFPGLGRTASNAPSANYQLIGDEMHKIAVYPDQARKIAESIETGSEDIFRDFDLSTFMDHFKLDPLEKTILGLAFKLGGRSELKTKVDAILSANFNSFVEILSRPNGPHHDHLNPAFVSLIVDRFIQYPPPNFTDGIKSELSRKVLDRYADPAGVAPPSEVMTALDLMRILADKPANALALHMQLIGGDFTKDEGTCVRQLQTVQSRLSNLQITEPQVSAALLYACISQNPEFKPSILIAALRKVLPSTFIWPDVIRNFDHKTARISSEQFLSLYHALLPVAKDDSIRPPLDIQTLWGGNWDNSEAVLSFVCAFASHGPDTLDATTIPGLTSSISLDMYEDCPPAVQERAVFASRHPLSSVLALSAVFHSALDSNHASQSTEAKRLFQEVVLPNIDLFVVSSFSVPKPWPTMASDTLMSLFNNFYGQKAHHREFVFESLWRKDSEWVVRQLMDVHVSQPTELPRIFELALTFNWLDVLLNLENGFGIDLAAYAHSQNHLDLNLWAQRHQENATEMANNLIQFLNIKAQFEGTQDPQAPPTSTPLHVKTVCAFFNIIENYLGNVPTPALTRVQRACVTVYPRLINYGAGFDDIIDSNSLNGNQLPQAANSRMEEHYKRMYGGEIDFREIVEILRSYKHSRDPLDQDAFACMIHGLFDEFTHYKDYPLEALATTAVLFGGIISHNLISGLPLKIGLDMIMEAVRDYPHEKPMFKFGFQALQTISSRFHEWPAFSRQLAIIENLRNSANWHKLQPALESLEEGSNQANSSQSDHQTMQPFSAIHIDPPHPDVESEPPSDPQQDRFKFLLNNVSEEKLIKTCEELESLLEHKYLQWFAIQLVEERAKGQPNYHNLYLDLVNILNDRDLWDEILRETYVSVARLLNSESTALKGNDRTHLKNLAGWLGLLTLARDKPVKHKNIAFKQLLLEAHETNRLPVVIPFVCKVLIQGAKSTVFKPPNPWLMDIIHLLIAIYHEASIKLNLKFEIEVLCKGLNLDHKSIKPPEGILQRSVLVEPSNDHLLVDRSDVFESVPLNGISVAASLGLSQQSIAAEIPDLTEQLSIPPTNEMVISPARLLELVRASLTRAISEIIQPVVDRSVTIAAISTQQLISKDFIVEPDENKLRTSAANMVKSTAGSLALVTCKDPLKQTFTSYMRQLSNDANLSLPEGTLLMCVNSNVEVGCRVIEKNAEDRAVPEIENFIAAEFETRRQRRAQKPMEPFVARPLDRWSSAIPEPYRIVEGMRGLTPEQMAIYDDFARHPRANGVVPSNLATPLSEARQALGPDALQDQFVGSIAPLAALPEPINPSHSVAAQAQPYMQTQQNMLVNRVLKLSHDLSVKVSAATELSNEHFANIPRQNHPIIDAYDHLMTAIINVARVSEDLTMHIAQDMVIAMCSLSQSTLGVETYLSVLSQLRGMSSNVVSVRVREMFRHHVTEHLQSRPLFVALLQTDLLDWYSIDMFVAQGLHSHSEAFLQLLEQIIDLALLNDQPVIFYADIIRSLEAAWNWIQEESNNTVCVQLKTKLEEASLLRPTPANGPESEIEWDQFEYVFQEWSRICAHPEAREVLPVFIKQMQARKLLRNKEDFYVLIRVAMEICATQSDARTPDQVDEGLGATEALSRLIGICLGSNSPVLDVDTNRQTFLSAFLAITRLVIYRHHTQRGEHFAQRMYFKLLSLVMLQVNDLHDSLAVEEMQTLMLLFAKTLSDLGPRHLPGFFYGWMHLVQHRVLLPTLLKSERVDCEQAFTDLLCQQLMYLGEQLKAPDVHDVSKDVYRATLKLLLVLNHDFPDYLALNHNTLCRYVPYHCAQILLVLLTATPHTEAVRPLRMASLLDCHQVPPSTGYTADVLQELGLLDIIDEALRVGPSEATVAHIAHAICHAEHQETTFGHVPVPANSAIIENVVMHVANSALAHDIMTEGEVLFPADSAGFKLLTMLVREVDAATSYCIIAFIGNQLRYPSGHTAYFVYFILGLFWRDPMDPDATEVRQQITRVLLERYIPFWSQPWGVLLTVAELLKSDQFSFYELPFIKAYPEVAERFSSVLRASVV